MTCAAVKDMMGRKVLLPEKINRVVSLVPSQTELLYYIGIQPVGQTLFCVHPDEHFKTSVKIGGTKKLNIEKIKSLKPDLIIGNKEENDEDQIKELAEHFPVWMSDIYTLDDALRMIHEVGRLLDVVEKANDLANQIRVNFNKLTERKSDPKRVMYLIWRKPYMAAGKHTFINDMLKSMGLENVLNQNRYPEVSEDDLERLNPNIVLLSSEPYPFKEKHIQELKTILPASQIVLVNGEYFSWYGNRLLDAPSYFNTLLEKLKR